MNQLTSQRKNYRSKQKESSIHAQVAKYLKLQYPDVIFRTDFAAGIKMSIGQAVKHKSLQSGSKYPDLFIAQPAGQWHGLFLELKRDRSEVYLLGGNVLKNNQHVKEQEEMLNQLRRRGYCAHFGCGFDGAKRIIDSYLSLVK